jgi:hypothetical protein
MFIAVCEPKADLSRVLLRAQPIDAVSRRLCYGWPD